MILPASAMPVINNSVPTDFVEYWKFNSMVNDGTYDVSYGVKNRTAYSLPAQVSYDDLSTNGFVRRANTTPFVALSNDQVFNPTGLPISEISTASSGTISFWARNLDGSGNSLNFSRTASNNTFICMGRDAFTFRGGTDTLGSLFWQRIYNLPVGYDFSAWHHFCYMTNSTRVIDLYIDGVLMTVASTSGTPSTARNWFNDLPTAITRAEAFRLVRGASPTVYESGTNASLDNLLIYNRELTLAEVQLIYNLGRNG